MKTKTNKRFSFGQVSSLRGSIYAVRARSSPGGARTDPVVRISVHSNKFRGQDQKKRSSSSRILSLRRDVHSWFRPKTKLYPRLGATSPGRIALQWHWACYYVLGHNPCQGDTYLAWGSTNSGLGGDGLEIPPPVALDRVFKIYV